MTSGVPVDDQVKATAVALYASGKTCAETAALIGCSAPAVWHWVKASNPNALRSACPRKLVEMPRQVPGWQPPVTGSAFIKSLPLGRLMAGR